MARFLFALALSSLAFFLIPTGNHASASTVNREGCHLTVGRVGSPFIDTEITVLARDLSDTICQSPGSDVIDATHARLVELYGAANVAVTSDVTDYVYIWSAAIQQWIFTCIRVTELTVDDEHVLDASVRVEGWIEM